MSIKYLSITSHSNTRSIAYYHDIPENATYSILWLSGYCSVMNSTKANAIAEWANNHTVEMIRFDYSGLGESSGEFATANLSQWLEEALMIYQHIQHRPTIIIGSSMGAWLALRLTETLQQMAQVMPSQLLLLAPAVDFTHELLLPALSDKLMSHLKAFGKLVLPTQYEYELDTLDFYQQFIDDAEQHLMLNRAANITTPMTIIHGEQDLNIPISHAYKTIEHFPHAELISVPGAAHRLSREQDIQLILKTLEDLQ